MSGKSRRLWRPSLRDRRTCTDGLLTDPGLIGQEHELTPRSRALHQLVGANDLLKRQAFGDDGSNAAFGEQPEQQGEILTEPLAVLFLEGVYGVEGGPLAVGQRVPQGYPAEGRRAEDQAAAAREARGEPIPD
jgi:hypothetical protein